MTNHRRPHYWVIGLLVVLNLVTLGIIWGGKLQAPPRSGPVQPNEQDIGRFLRSELGLSDEQVRRFTDLQRLHVERIQRLREEINDLKRGQLTVQLATAAMDTARAARAARAIADKQYDLELLTFLHFAELRSLVSDQQAGKLESLLPELIPGPQRPGPPGGSPPRPPADHDVPPRG